MKFVILTVSDKNSGYCVTGYDMENPTKWIRLVGINEHFNVTDDEAVYENGKLCQPLDVIEVNPTLITGITVTCPDPKNMAEVYIAHHYPKELLEIQPENHYVTEKFAKIGEITLDEVITAFPPVKPDYIYCDANCCIGPDAAGRLGQSLVMVEIENIKMYPVSHINENSKCYNNHFKASFEYNNRVYEGITVTDPAFLPEKPYYSGLYIEKCYAVISLGVLFRGAHYKLIAKLFPQTKMIKLVKKMCDALNAINTLDYFRESWIMSKGHSSIRVSFCTHKEALLRYTIFTFFEKQKEGKPKPAVYINVYDPRLLYSYIVSDSQAKQQFEENLKKRIEANGTINQSVVSYEFKTTKENSGTPSGWLKLKYVTPETPSVLSSIISEYTKMFELAISTSII